MNKIAQLQGEIVVDPDSYIQNCSSPNAKHINTFEELIVTKLWIDLHYKNRAVFGDDDGSAREGIGIEVVERLVLKSFKHLLYYALKHKNFVFINHPPPPVNSYSIRIVLKEFFKDEIPLNVIVEFQYDDSNCYEVTIITAMRKKDFYFSDGQYAVELRGDVSTLVFKQYKVESTVDSYNLTVVDRN